MAENDQHLKHGKALCGKVFGRFVETFNALVDFMLGIKGDADGKNGEGHITYDRENNIIRCDGCGGKGGGGGGDDPDEPESPEDVDPYEDDDDYDPDDDQDLWYENPEDSPSPGGKGGGGGEGGGGGGCNDWSGDPGAGLGGEANSGWSGDNCGSINDFSR